MASGFSVLASKKIADGDLDLTGDTLKLMLLQDSFDWDPTVGLVDSGSGANNAHNNECSATGYTGGFGGSGRKTATITSTEQDGSLRTAVKLASVTWSSLGNGTNQTIQWVALVKEITNDAASLILCVWEVTPLTTDGSNLVLGVDSSNGNIRITTPQA